jgi:hypothetical protein
MPRVAGRIDGPCDPRAPVQSLWGAGLGVPSRPPGLPWVVSTIRSNAGPCREGGLSSTDERVRGHVSPKSHRLFGSRPNGPRVAHTYSRDDLNTS